MTKIFAIDVRRDGRLLLDMVAEYIHTEIHWVKSESELMRQLQSAEKSVVLYPDDAADNVYDACAAIAQKFPQTTALLVFAKAEDLDIKQTLRSGVADAIFLDDPMHKIKEDLTLAIEESKNKVIVQLNEQVAATTSSNVPKNAKIITVASTKGGVGKTTVAVNLAAAFGKKGAQVAVVDLDLQFGDVALFLDVKPRRTIYDWVKEDHDGSKIANFLTPVKQGISILAAPQRPEFAEVITGDDIQKAISALKKQFDVVIIDVATHMNEIAIVAQENSDEILVMTYLDLPTLKNSKMLIDTLGSLELGERVKVVLNRNMKVKGINRDTVQGVLGKEIFSFIPVMEKAMVTAVNKGNPICFSKPKSRVGKQIFQMAEKLIPTKKKKGKKTKQMVHAGGEA